MPVILLSDLDFVVLVIILGMVYPGWIPPRGDR